jgi:hypothetical protein
VITCSDILKINRINRQLKLFDYIPGYIWVREGVGDGGWGKKSSKVNIWVNDGNVIYFDTENKALEW